MAARRRALVTGGGRGLGRGICLTLARRGWDVAVNYARNGAAAEETAAACAAAAPDGRFITVGADISVAADRESLVSRCWDALGGLDALVNNAGVAPERRADLLDADTESFRRLLTINLEGPYFLTQLVARRWLAGGAVSAGEGIPAEPSRSDVGASSGVFPESSGASGAGKKIVFVTSVSAVMASVNRGDYCVSKAGLSMAVKLWAARLAGEGIPVYEVRPGIMKTDMTAAVSAKYDALIADGLVPQKRWGTGEDVGAAVAGLLSGDFPFSTGSVIQADGGLSLERL